MASLTSHHHFLSTQENTEINNISFLILSTPLSERSYVALTATDNGKVAGIVSLAFLGAICLSVIFTIYGLSPFILKKHEGMIPIVFFKFIPAGLYINGDNISVIIQRYGEDLGCGERCADNNQI